MAFEDDITLDTESLSDLRERLKGVRMEAKERMSAAEKKSALYMLRVINDRFKNEGPNNDGEKWPELADSTKAARRKGKKKRSPKILQDTGRLRQGITFEKIMGGAVVFPSVSYAKYHHPTELTGHPSKGIMKNRSFMYVTEGNLNSIIKFYDDELSKSLKQLIGKIKRFT